MEAEGGLRMKTRRTHSSVQKSPVKEKRYTMSDTEAQGLLVRVEPSGGNHFYCDSRNPRTGKRVQRRLSLTSELTVTQVRDLVQKTRVSVRTDEVGPTQMERGHACTAIPGRTGPALHTLDGTAQKEYPPITNNVGKLQRAVPPRSLKKVPPRTSHDGNRTIPA